MMKTTHVLLLVAAAFLIGQQFGSRGESTATAQSISVSSPVQIGRYQISSWSHPASPGNASDYGCYVVDTVTGQLWHKHSSQTIQNAADPRK